MLSKEWLYINRVTAIGDEKYVRRNCRVMFRYPTIIFQIWYDKNTQHIFSKGPY